MQRFKNILLLFDNKTDSKAALAQAIDLSKRNEAHLTVVDVAEHLAHEAELWLSPEVLARLRLHDLEIRERALEQVVELIQQEGIRVTTKVLIGVPFLQIIREVLRHQYDLVIMTADGSDGLKEQLFGSTSLHLMRKCPCPVWVVKPDQPGLYN